MRTDCYFITVGPKKSCEVKAQTSIQPEANGWKCLSLMNRQQILHYQKMSELKLMLLREFTPAETCQEAKRLKW